MLFRSPVPCLRVPTGTMQRTATPRVFGLKGRAEVFVTYEAQATNLR